MNAIKSQAERPIDRLREYITSKALADSAFERSAGLSNGYINKASKGNGGIGSEILQKIHGVYPDLSLMWVITGEEVKKAPSKRYSSPAADNVVHELPSIYLTGKVEDGLVKMPVMDMRFAAGASSYAPDYMETADFVFIPRNWLRKGQNFACGRIRGDSMAPTLLDGGYGVIRMLDKGEWENMPDEEIYVVVTKDSQLANIQVKRVKNRFARGFVVMMSDNPDKVSNPNFNIYTEEILSIWHLDWYFTSRMPNIHNQYYSRLQSLEDKVEDLLSEIKPVLRKAK